MRKFDCSTEGGDGTDLVQMAMSEGRKRTRMLLLLSALSLPACGKSVVQNSQDAAPPDAVPVAMPASYGEFEKPNVRAKFAGEFAKTLDLNKKSEHFFLPLDYQWKLEEAMKRAGESSGAKGELPTALFQQTDNAVLAVSLKRLLDDWAEFPLSPKQYDAFLGAYHSQAYRHYRNVRYLEVLPDQPERKGVGDIEKLVQGWMERDQKAWQLTVDSPFFGIKNDPASGGPLDKPFSPAIQKTITEIVDRIPSHGIPEFKQLYYTRIQHSVLDMYLPGMYLEAIKGRLKLAGLSAEDLGMSDQAFEQQLKKAFDRRFQVFSKCGRGYSPRNTERQVLDAVGGRFKAISAMDHPLEFYGHK